MIDIEKIADNVRAKETVFNVTTPCNPPIQIWPLEKEVFIARDIKDLNDRQKYLLDIIKTEKENETTEKYGVPLLNGLKINGKEINFNFPEKVRITMNARLVNHCESELMQLADLLYITKIVNEFKAIEGENKKLHYLLKGKDGYAKSMYKSPEYYTENEFAQIVETAAKMTCEKPNVENEHVLNSLPLLQWNAPITSLYTLFYDLLDKKIITWNGKTIEGAKMGIAGMLSTYFIDKDKKTLSIETIKQTLKPNTPKAKKRVDISAITLPLKKTIKKT